MVKGLPASPLLQTHGRRPDKRAANGTNHGTSNRSHHRRCRRRGRCPRSESDDRFGAGVERCNRGRAISDYLSGTDNPTEDYDRNCDTNCQQFWHAIMGDRLETMANLSTVLTSYILLPSPPFSRDKNLRMRSDVAVAPLSLRLQQVARRRRPGRLPYRTSSCFRRQEASLCYRTPVCRP